MILKPILNYNIAKPLLLKLIASFGLIFIAKSYDLIASSYLSKNLRASPSYQLKK